MIIDFGQERENTDPRAQTALELSRFSSFDQAQFRAFTRPLDLQESHLHAAGEENWKWNAIKSFFVRLQKG